MMRIIKLSFDTLNNMHNRTKREKKYTESKEEEKREWLFFILLLLPHPLSDYMFYMYIQENK